MSAKVVTLSHSIAALAEDAAGSEAALLAVATACPGVALFDVIGARGVRVTAEGVVDATPPAHAGKVITRGPRARFRPFEEHGDLLLPDWDPALHAFELEIAGKTRVLGDLGQMLAALEEEEDEERDEEDRAFVRVVREALETARTERLAVVVLG